MDVRFGEQRLFTVTGTDLANRPFNPITPPGPLVGA